ncbi:hypothetical protein D9615_002706 [Tricholomella constricta]|uniref:Association with the SNF1 complex (ASC) domain-containing protein n=1 Tax=Tricholomella constricta TaxID=117010 RepID=A0A8H5HFM2_9AGAR|nr:hypothetical protein D9615_002706 [Tricholomella constricta]
MGNASSHASGQRPATISPRPRQASTSPSSDNPHSSLRLRKRSLELPDFASLNLSSTRGRQHSIPPKSASIPIPPAPYPAIAIPGEAGRTRAPITLPSNADVQLLAAHEPSTHQPFPPPSRNTRSAQRRQAQQQQRIQELYNQSQAPAPSPPHPPVFVPETVHSTIPIALTQAVYDVAPPVPEPVPVIITWRGGGKSVFLARAGDDDWKGRLAMTQESPTSSVYHATVSLPPGTHHIRFLIDDLWRVADDLPTAVDDQGSLANYVAVPITYSPPAPINVPASPPATSALSKPKPGQSFWSAASSTDDESQDAAETPSSPQQPSQAKQHSHHHHHHHHVPCWTTVLPPELIEAAREEEAYLAASEPQQGQGHHRVQGFVPAPNIPPAPGLPRHLDKLILNSRAVTGGAGGAVIGAPPGGSSGGAGRRSGREATGRYGAQTGASNSVGGRSKGRERERKEKERERDRDRERDDRRRDRERDRRGNPPPPPPPSEAGTLDIDTTPEVEVTAPPPENLSASTSPVISAPPSPVPGEASTPVPAHFIPSFLPTTPPPISITPTPTSIAAAAAAAGSTPTASTTPVPVSNLVPSTSAPGSRPLTLSLEANTPALTDDASVLPVPSHVVLHHLSTSAIRNGVLAVGNTTRYRKKYLTTIYYKPT